MAVGVIFRRNGIDACREDFIAGAGETECRGNLRAASLARGKACLEKQD